MSDTTMKCDGSKVGKHNKSLLERQRRARINKSLEQIKDLILSNIYKDDPQMFAEKSSERMDKAEILEFAVDYFKHLNLLQLAARPTRTTSLTTPHNHLVADPRLHYPLPPPAMVYTSHPTSKHPKIDQSQLQQPWMNIVRCTDKPYFSTVESSIPSPSLSQTYDRDAEETTTTGQAIKNDSLGSGSGVWRPW